MSKAFMKRLVLILVLIISVAGCQSKPTASIALKERLSNETKGTVVLLHGLWRSSYAMNPSQEYFEALGYQVVNLSYPSTKHDIPTLVEDFLQPEIEKLIQSSPGPIHFVTHSMGGILVRYYLQNNDLEQAGKVVMLAPPNKGSELVDSTSEWPFASPSPAASQLSSAQDSWVNGLTPIDFELGVIAGNKNNNLVTAALLPGPNDGVVTVASTQTENMRDFIVVPLRHYNLRDNTYVLQQSAHFIQYGNFYRE